VADHAAFLRGVNVGRHRRVGKEDLRASFEAAGFDDVDTFRTSGNVVFGGADGSVDDMKSRIEAALAKSLGYDVTVFVRSADEVRAIAASEPFPTKQVEQSKGKLQVSLLPAAPPAPAKKEVLTMATDDDRLAFGDRELYWLPSGGQMETELDLSAIEKLVGPTTRRTMGTLEQLAAKYF
jgi:uncharacterized protein (DUF1697 family)